MSIKKILKTRSLTLAITTFLESLLALFSLTYFNYLDRLSYAESVINKTSDLALLIENMYTSTWWALIILTLCLIVGFKIIGFIYKDERFILLSIILWVILLILAINIKDSIVNNLSTLAIFIPIIGFNIKGFISQKKLNRK